MKRYIVFLLLGASCALLFRCWRREGGEESNLCRTLKQESLGPFDREKKLYIAIGIDYIPHELIETFEKITGIQVIIDIFDSNEILEAKLLAGGVKYDIVFPTAWPNFSRQLKAGIYQKLDKNRINMAIFAKDVLKRLEKHDAGNNYAVPFQFGIAGLGVNEKIVTPIIGKSEKGSLSIVFDPSNAEKLSKYRISLYESPNELFPIVMAYLGLDPESENPEDIVKAAEHLRKIRPYISKFTSFGFEDLATENACAALGTSGDILKVQRENPSIKFYYPEEGASLWVDVVAILAKAKHPNNIYAFLKFLFHPMVIAEVTNVTSRANAVVKAEKYLLEEVKKNSYIYPSEAVFRKCYIEKPLPSHVEALKTRLLTQIKSMEN
ncbi:MAG: extracellular solute-binding protein [Holosporaceae bacterium]|jgi:putrescine transport system substrate-binding protein|nr:extracellular solute-binding protein [Holosporaceae bacterium]